MKKTLMAIAILSSCVASPVPAADWEGIYSITPNRALFPTDFVTLQENNGAVVMAVLGTDHGPWEAYVGTIDPDGRINLSLEFAPSDGTQSSSVGIELDYHGEAVMYMDYCASRWVKNPYFAPDGFVQEGVTGGGVSDYDDAISYTIEYEWVEKGCFLEEGQFAHMLKVF